MARSRLAFARRLGIFGAFVSDRGATQQALLFRTATALTLAFGAATTANADTIRFGLVTGNRGGASVSLSSDGFSFGANISPFANFGHDILCDPCGPGSTLSLAGVATGLDLIGSITIGNVSFHFAQMLQFAVTNVCTLGLLTPRDQRRYRAAGEFAVWPFFRRSDYEAALRTPKLLNRAV